MVNARRAVQEADERFIMGQFLEAINRRHRATFQVIEEPNPPEAILRSGRTTRWAEVVTAFWNAAHAKDLYSYATPGEKHTPVGDGIFMNMTPEFAKNFANAVGGKLEKTSYVPFRERFGPGYLLVSIRFPFFGDDALPFMAQAFSERGVRDLGCFRSIYLIHQVFGGASKVTRWHRPI